MPATDEIYEKYLQKAIVEINDLAHEVAQAGGARVPVMGSGHPLADVMLLKHRPQSAEVQEGVAFYGRAGQAILKSLQRLHVDPMSVYGTNCVKFADGDEDESRPFLLRELHIVQPKLIVVMGEQALAFLNSVAFPLAREVAPTEGELQKFSGVLHPATWNTNARKPNAAARTIVHRHVRKGRTSQTSAKQAGMRAKARKAMSHHRLASHSRSWNA